METATASSLGLGALATRAYDLLDSVGRPVTEEQLVRHVFGLAGTRNPGFWRGQLTRVLASHAHFTQLVNGSWSLATWQQAADTLRSLRYVVVDVETTGLSPRTHRLIEIAALRCQGTEVVDVFTTLVDPKRPIPAFIRSFTGITDDMVRGAPSPAEAVESFLRFTEADLLLGHNVRFDLNFLGAVAEQDLGLTIANDSLDTIALGTLLVPGLRRPSLDRLATALGLAAPTRHRALADAELTAQAFWQLIARGEENGIATLERLQSAVLGQASHVRPRRSDGRTGRALLNPRLRENLPTGPGVYLMKDERGEVIYVGKAKNLRARVSSYYTQPLGYRRKTDGLLESIRDLETIVVGSELQALILENQLIKSYQPRFNVQQRNYEQYPFIKIDVQNPFPRVFSTREIEADGARYFGPYRSGQAVKIMIALVQRLFPIRTCTRKLGDTPPKKHGSRCLRHAMGRCLAPCHGGVSSIDYHQVIDQVCEFLGGTGDELLSRVEAELYSASNNMRFERAAQLRDLLREARRVLVAQQLLSGAVERHNLLIVYPSSAPGYVEIFGVRHGRLQEQMRLNAGSSKRALRTEIGGLCRRLLHSQEPPPVIRQDEVDSINIIARWIFHHSNDRHFIPLGATLGPTVEHALAALSTYREICL